MFFTPLRVVADRNAIDGLGVRMFLTTSMFLPFVSVTALRPLYDPNEHQHHERSNVLRTTVTPLGASVRETRLSPFKCHTPQRLYANSGRGRARATCSRAQANASVTPQQRKSNFEVNDISPMCVSPASGGSGTIFGIATLALRSDRMCMISQT